MAEKKYIDQIVGQTNQLGWNVGDMRTNAMRISLFNGILIGTAANANSRVGNKIYVSGVYLTITIQPDPSKMSADGCTCRFMLVRNKEAGQYPKTGTGGAGPSPPYGISMTDPLEVALFGFGINAARNSTYFHKYDILLDRMHVMTPFTQTTSSSLFGGGPTFRNCFYIPVKRQIEYVDSTYATTTTTYTAGAGSTTTDILDGMARSNNLLKDDLHFLIGADGGGGECQASVSWKVLFTDA